MVTLAAAVLAAAAVAGADAPTPGEKVRVTTRASDETTGVVVQADAETLTVSLGSKKPPVRIPLGSIQRLEVARGRRTAAKEGAISGGLVGVVLGVAAVYVASHALCEYDTDCDASPQAYG